MGPSPSTSNTIGSTQAGAINIKLFPPPFKSTVAAKQRAHTFTWCPVWVCAYGVKPSALQYSQKSNKSTWQSSKKSLLDYSYSLTTPDIVDADAHLAVKPSVNIRTARHSLRAPRISGRHAPTTADATHHTNNADMTLKMIKSRILKEKVH